MEQCIKLGPIAYRFMAIYIEWTYECASTNIITMELLCHFPLYPARIEITIGSGLCLGLCSNQGGMAVPTCLTPMHECSTPLTCAIHIHTCISVDVLLVQLHSQQQITSLHSLIWYTDCATQFCPDSTTDSRGETQEQIQECPAQ